MKLEEIETFLMVIETNNILQAASKLYISQSTASTRIKNLEEELGYPLFIRSKGNRNIEITPKGEAFLPIARSFVSLMKDALQIKDQKQRVRLKIGTTVLIQTTFLKDYYRDWMKLDELYLNIENHHSHQIHELIEKQKLDLGFVTNRYPYPNITAIKIKEERLVLLLPKDKSIKHLEEIHLSYSSDYEIYFEKHFPDVTKSIRVASSLSLLELMDDKHFCIIPEHLAQNYIAKNKAFKIEDLHFPYVLTIYAIWDQHARLSIQPQIQILLDSLQV